MHREKKTAHKKAKKTAIVIVIANGRTDKTNDKHNNNRIKTRFFHTCIYASLAIKLKLKMSIAKVNICSSMGKCSVVTIAATAAATTSTTIAVIIVFMATPTNSKNK